MSILIKQFEKEHQAIVDAFNQVKELGIGRKEGQDRLRAAKAGLLAHLKKEDQKLYPVLHKEAASNPALKRTLEIFAKDMDQVSQAALAFFDKYENGGEGLEFARDFGRLFSVLASRIRKEESLLYKEYDKIAEGSSETRKAC